MLRTLATSVVSAAGALWITAGSTAATEPRLIELAQVPCQFLESKGGTDRDYKSRSIKDCEAINARTGSQRVAQAKPLHLKPGKYVFRVTNRNVPYELGFWLRGASAVSRVTLPSVSGGGLIHGKTGDYEIELKPGEYVYSCPLNNTPITSSSCVGILHPMDTAADHSMSNR